MAKICLSLTAKTLGQNLELLDKYHQYADIAELRVDCLEPNERLMIRRFPEMTDMPVILTIRRNVDGGHFISGEGARVNLMARGLAYANADRRRNFAYVEIEKDLIVPSLEEAARAFGTRIIRSYHDLKGYDTDLAAKIRSMRQSDDEIVKVVVAANSISDVLELLRAGREYAGREKILIARGHYGICSRILAEQFGSFLSYAGVLSGPASAAERAAGSIASAANISHSPEPGQINVVDLANLYRFRSIGNATGIYGITGYPLKTAGSSYFVNTIFGLEDIDAVHVPFPADSIGACLELAQELKVKGLSITVPHKETVIPYLGSKAAEVQKIGACNILSMGPHGWMGTNTDTRGFSDSLLKFIGRPHLKRQRVTVIGAGGSARAVAFELHRLGAKALILNRLARKARDLAAPYKFAWGGLDSQGIEMMDRYRDIIIQTTPAGTEEHKVIDPVQMYRFSGREKVMDLAYMPEMTVFLKRAADAGCQVQNGYDMFVRQTQYQYTQFLGKEFPDHLVSRVQFYT